MDRKLYVWFHFLGNTCGFLNFRSYLALQVHYFLMYSIKYTGIWEIIPRTWCNCKIMYILHALSSCMAAVRQTLRRTKHTETPSYFKAASTHTICTTCFQSVLKPVFSLWVFFFPYFILIFVVLAVTSPGAMRLQALHSSSQKEQLFYAPYVSQAVKQRKSTHEEPHTIFLPAVCNQARKYPLLRKILRATSAYLTCQQWYSTRILAPLTHVAGAARALLLLSSSSRSALLPVCTMPGLKEKSWMRMKHKPLPPRYMNYF